MLSILLLLSCCDSFLDIVDTLLNQVELGLVVIAFCGIDSQVFHLRTSLVERFLISGDRGLQRVVLVNSIDGFGLVSLDSFSDRSGQSSQAIVIRNSSTCSVNLVSLSSVGRQFCNSFLLSLQIGLIVIGSLIQAILRHLGVNGSLGIVQSLLNFSDSSCRSLIGIELVVSCGYLTLQRIDLVVSSGLVAIDIEGELTSLVVNGLHLRLNSVDSILSLSALSGKSGSQRLVGHLHSVKGSLKIRYFFSQSCIGINISLSFSLLVFDKIVQHVFSRKDCYVSSLVSDSSTGLKRFIAGLRSLGDLRVDLFVQSLLGCIEQISGSAHIGLLDLGNSCIVLSLDGSNSIIDTVVGLLILIGILSSLGFGCQSINLFLDSRFGGIELEGLIVVV